MRRQCFCTARALAEKESSVSSQKIHTLEKRAMSPSQRHAPLSPRLCSGHRAGQGVREDKGRPRFGHLHSGDLQERGIPRGPVQTHHLSQRSSVPNAKGSPRRPQPRSVRFRRVKGEPVAIAHAMHHPFLRVVNMAAHLEFSIAAKQHTHSVNQFLKEQGIVSQLVLDHRLPKGELAVDIRRSPHIL